MLKSNDPVMRSEGAKKEMFDYIKNAQTYGW